MLNIGKNQTSVVGRFACNTDGFAAIFVGDVVVVNTNIDLAIIVGNHAHICCCFLIDIVGIAVAILSFRLVYWPAINQESVG